MLQHITVRSSKAAIDRPRKPEWLQAAGLNLRARGDYKNCSVRFNNNLIPVVEVTVICMPSAHSIV